MALARQEQPDLVPRPRGRLRQEEGVSKKQQRMLSHAGDVDAFNAYVAEHRDRLKQTAAEISQQAKQTLANLSTTEVPFSNREWLDWFESGGGA
eukprot:8146736-Karenia_brevis.AAC.1